MHIVFISDLITAVALQLPFRLPPPFDFQMRFILHQRSSNAWPRRQCYVQCGFRDHRKLLDRAVGETVKRLDGKFT